MKKIAVFGKPGSGKSTVSRALAAAVNIPLYQLDSILYKANGELIKREDFEVIHQNILSSEKWLIDGFGPVESFNKRLAAADTLVYIDLPYRVSYWFVVKRFLKSIVTKPEGWPDGSSVLKGTIASIKTLRQCPRFWNDDFTAKLQRNTPAKSLYIIKSVKELERFVRQHAK
ncbi:adenylate kinase [Pseudoalteromonas piscicida]|uniref:adenylate kinase n=1 Tax=Pseudoalteromonas piscicida TaxID=43662 RepID=UPI0030B4B6CB